MTDMELKTYIAPTPDGTGLADYYLKSEADKVIAEKDKQLRRQKFKRCLAMALLALEKRESYKAEYEEWCLKWYHRWLELAEKFKEAK